MANIHKKKFENLMRFQAEKQLIIEEADKNVGLTVVTSLEW